MKKQQHWATSLIGEPWTPDRNCWWLVTKVFAERYGINMPPVRVGDLGDSTNVANIKQASQESGWIPAEEPPRDGDLALMRGKDSARHVGVIIETADGLRLLHSDGHMGTRGPVGSVVADSLDVMHNDFTSVELWRRKE